MSCHVNVSFCDGNEMASSSEIQIVILSFCHFAILCASPSVQINFPEKARLVFVVVEAAGH